MIALWFLLSFIFPPLGKFLIRIFKDTVDIIKGDDSENDN